MAKDNQTMSVSHGDQRVTIHSVGSGCIIQIHLTKRQALELSAKIEMHAYQLPKEDESDDN